MRRIIMMRNQRKNKGFTLIEILLVTVIIGVMLAVIVPRAWRANIDSKYGLIRQQCSELAAWGSEWGENQLLAQESDQSTSTMYSYLRSLAGTGTGLTRPSSAWVAYTVDSNWNKRGNLIPITGRYMNGDADEPPETHVENIAPPERIPRNPFNQVNIFQQPNDPSAAGVSNVTPGAIACGVIDDTNLNFAYFAFVFQGTDSTTTTLGTADTTTFHAGMESRTVSGLRNGIFFARLTHSGS